MKITNTQDGIVVVATHNELIHLPSARNAENGIAVVDFTKKFEDNTSRIAPEIPSGQIWRDGDELYYVGEWYRTSKDGVVRTYDTERVHRILLCGWSSESEHWSEGYNYFKRDLGKPSIAVKAV